MKRFLVIFLIIVIAISSIGVVAIASILLFSGQNETIIPEQQPSLSHILYTSSDLTDNETPALPEPEVSAAPVSNAGADILLINARNPSPQNYKPVELVNLYKQKGRHFQLARSDIEICRAVFTAMESMFSAAMKDGVDGFIITSGYRSFDKQAEIFASNTDGTAARPGTSEHESGLAFDVTAYGNENFELTRQFEWLAKHCGEYGFILRYPKGAESVTGRPYEPWHFRYVGVSSAKAIMDMGITLEEYLEKHYCYSHSTPKRAQRSERFFRRTRSRKEA